MRNRIYSILLSVALLCLGVLSGCGGQNAHSGNVASNDNSEHDSDKIVNTNDNLISVTGWLKESYTQNLMAFLAEKYPEYQFEYQYITKQSYEHIIDAQLSSKETADIIMVNPAMAKRHGKNGYIEDLSQFEDGFSSAAIKALSYEDKMFAIPSTSEYLCTFYNMDIREKK